MVIIIICHLRLYPHYNICEKEWQKTQINVIIEHKTQNLKISLRIIWPGILRSRPCYRTARIGTIRRLMVRSVTLPTSMTSSTPRTRSPSIRPSKTLRACISGITKSSKTITTSKTKRKTIKK